MFFLLLRMNVTVVHKTLYIFHSIVMSFPVNYCGSFCRYLMCGCLHIVWKALFIIVCLCFHIVPCWMWRSQRPCARWFSMIDFDPMISSDFLIVCEAFKLWCCFVKELVLCSTLLCENRWHLECIPPNCRRTNYLSEITEPWNIPKLLNFI